jgi:hypothetical protein
VKLPADQRYGEVQLGCALQVSRGEGRSTCTSLLQVVV